MRNDRTLRGILEDWECKYQKVLKKVNEKELCKSVTEPSEEEEDTTRHEECPEDADGDSDWGYCRYEDGTDHRRGGKGTGKGKRVQLQRKKKDGSGGDNARQGAGTKPKTGSRKGLTCTRCKPPPTST